MKNERGVDWDERGQFGIIQSAMSDLAKIETMLVVGEGDHIEFKRASDGPKADTYESICTFLNHTGGELLLGIGDKGDPPSNPPSNPPSTPPSRRGSVARCVGGWGKKQQRGIGVVGIA